MPTPTAKTVFIFFGEDDFSMRRKLATWKREFAKKYSDDAVVHLERGEGGEKEMISQLEQALSPSLFSSRKLILAKDFLPAKAAESALGQYLLDKVGNMPQDLFLVLWQTVKPDRRLGSVKKIFSSDATITEFELPHGKTLNSWLKAYAQTLGLELDDAAAEELAIYLGRDFYEEKKAGGKVIERKEAFDLWQARSELEKLASYTKRADVAAVRALVKPKVTENVFALADELVKKNQKGAMDVLENLLGLQNTDEKSAAIKIVGLLAEQVRGLLLVKVLQDEGKSAGEIAEDLGWSSGRVFILTKNASGQTLDNLKRMVTMLTEIDSRLKSTDDNPKLLINQFILAATK
jgi:DNA polymerase-3 subunit delta